MFTEAEPFDADWYSARYPDVVASGLDPAEHYRWLGRRLGRLPVPPAEMHGRAAPAGVGLQSRATVKFEGGEYSDSAIGHALKSLCAWLFPEEAEAHGSKAGKCYDLVAQHFWNDGSQQNINQNGKLLVDFMRDFGNSAQATKALRKSPISTPERILLVSFYAPSRSHAGGLRILDLYEEIRQRRPEIYLSLFCARNPSVDGDVSILTDVFDDVFTCEPAEFSPETLLGLSAGIDAFDLIDLQFHQAGMLADGFRKFGRRLLYTPMEALTRGEFDLVRRRSFDGDFPLDRFFSLIHRGAEERKIMQSVDLTVCVSDADADFLRNFCGKSAVTYFPTGLSRSEFDEQLRKAYRPPAIEERKSRLVFAAYFGSETNCAGLEWYLREVHPSVLAACPHYNLAIVGRGDTSALERLGAKSVSFIGEVPRLSPVLEQCRGGLVLALHGSGFRGKINQYALCGLPSVSTSLGATGLDYTDGEDILIADAPRAFAQKCVTLLNGGTEARLLAKAARKRALEQYSWAAIWPRIASIYGLS